MLALYASCPKSLWNSPKETYVIKKTLEAHTQQYNCLAQVGAIHMDTTTGTNDSLRAVFWEIIHEELCRLLLPSCIYSPNLQVMLQPKCDSWRICNNHLLCFLYGEFGHILRYCSISAWAFAVPALTHCNYDPESDQAKSKATCAMPSACLAYRYYHPHTLRCWSSARQRLCEEGLPVPVRETKNRNL